MAPKTQIQYVRYYTPGSAAQKIAPVTPFKKAVRPVQKHRKAKRIYVDPVAIFGIAVAVCMLIFMVIGISGLNHARKQVQNTQAYVTQLSQSNERLEQQYRESYDLHEIEQLALMMGLVPQEDISRVTIPVSQPEPIPEPTVWQEIVTFLTGIFA